MTEMTQTKWKIWTGRILSLLPIPLFAMSAYFKLNPPAEMVPQMEKMGYTMEQMRAIGIVEIVCAVIYLIPQTAVLGAILLTGYLGGATEVHVRGKEPFIAPVIIGVVLWLGLYFRDPRLRELIPFRKR